MPYVMDHTDEAILRSAARDLVGAGDLTYALTVIVDEYLTDRTASYATFAEVLGAIEATKLELYRREIAPYEDTKIVANGDVYHDWTVYGGEG